MYDNDIIRKKIKNSKKIQQKTKRSIIDFTGPFSENFREKFIRISKLKQISIIFLVQVYWY